MLAGSRQDRSVGTGRAHGAWLSACALLVACCSRLSGGDLHSPVPEKRAAAIAALASSRDERDLPALLVAQRDPSALVRKAAASAFTARGGPRSVDALGKLLEDPDSEVVAAAARGLGAIPHIALPTDAREAEALQKRARSYLVTAYGRAGPPGRAEIAAAMQALGVSLREAVELESRQLWERNAHTLAGGAPAERCGAAEELGRSGRVEAVQRLLALLEPGPRRDAELAAAAARGLGAAGERSARPALEELLEEADAALAETAAEALGALGDPAAAETLARTGSNGSTPLAQVSLSALSGMPQAPEVGMAVCEIAVRAIDPTVAERAARLAHSREADCSERPLLVRVAGRGPDAAGALAALGALGLTGARAAVPAERALALVVTPPPDPTLRAVAAEALGRFGYAPGVPALLRRGQALVQKGPGDGAELAAIAGALARLRAQEAESFALSLMAHPDPTVRAGACEALGLLGGDANRERVSQALGDPSLRVRIAAAAALPRFHSASVSALSEAARRARPGEAEWRMALARALGETGSPEAVKALSEMLEGPEGPVAAAALGRLGVAEAVRPLLAVLERPHAVARVEAIDAIGQLPANDAGPALATELTNDRPDVRAAAARALGRLRFEGASAALEALRGDYYGEVRKAAVDALARLPARGGGRR
jgi:HEAT repeat protein